MPFDQSGPKNPVSAAFDSLMAAIDAEIGRMIPDRDGFAPQAIEAPTLSRIVMQCMKYAVLREKVAGLRADWRRDRDVGLAQFSHETTSIVRELASKLQPGRDAAHPRLAFTRQEAAKALGVSAVKIDRLVARGLIRPSLATRRKLFAPAELERFMRETSQVIAP